MILITNRSLLLLTCIREETGTKKINRLRNYTDQDWSDILAEADRHKIVPILFHTLKPLFPDLCIPEQIQDRLRKGYLHSSARNIRLFQKLLHIIAIFNREGISVILLKGAHLAGLVYEKPALRPMSDIDLLANEDDLPKIHKLLTDNGFTTSDQDQGAIQRHVAPYRSNILVIEIHYHIIILPENKRFDAAELWERGQKSTLQGVDILTLNPEDLLLHLCAHTSIQHGFDNGLIPYFDIARTIEHYDGRLNWEILLSRARAWGLERSIYLMLALTDKFIGLPVPGQICNSIKSDPDGLDALNAAEELIFEKSSAVTPFIARLFEERGWRTKLKYFVQRAFPPKEVMAIGKLKTESCLKLPCSYLLHIQNLYRKYGKIIWLGLRRNPEAVDAMENQNKRNMLRDWLVQDK